ncbi:MAG: DegT/DnrJ/EryC1/StrS aminotransferase family protein, partial [Campylobacteraceae bacterium]|nr:DegT/DnrJ/EryC1/StrS aminotransferase family protein [Campylobacteraceae bacterium]
MNIPFVDLKTQYNSLKSEIDTAIQSVIDRTAFIKGAELKEFENAYAEAYGVKHCIPVANGTDAIYIVLKMLGIGPGDEVITVANSWISTAETISQSGANPVFVDIDNYSTIDSTEIEEKITAKTKAIIPVHLYGQPANIRHIKQIAQKHNLYLIEDCAQAHGATYKGKSVGSIGHIGAWSFCQDKIMTTGGEGGMVTTDDEILWKKMWAYKDHGKSWDAVYEKEHPPGFRWLHESFGTNWRLTEIQSAIG